MQHNQDGYNVVRVARRQNPTCMQTCQVVELTTLTGARSNSFTQS